MKQYEMDHIFESQQTVCPRCSHEKIFKYRGGLQKHNKVVRPIDCAGCIICGYQWLEPCSVRFIADIDYSGETIREGTIGLLMDRDEDVYHPFTVEVNGKHYIAGLNEVELILRDNV